MPDYYKCYYLHSNLLEQKIMKKYTKIEVFDCVECYSQETAKTFLDVEDNSCVKELYSAKLREYEQELNRVFIKLRRKHIFSKFSLSVQFNDDIVQEYLESILDLIQKKQYQTLSSPYSQYNLKIVYYIKIINCFQKAQECPSARLQQTLPQLLNERHIIELKCSHNKNLEKFTSLFHNNTLKCIICHLQEYNAACHLKLLKEYQQELEIKINELKNNFTLTYFAMKVSFNNKKQIKILTLIKHYKFLHDDNFKNSLYLLYLEKIQTNLKLLIETFQTRLSLCLNFK
ncbi:hypothetical protein AB837_00543 [bacterium AB1]|nr:hypothetical protein AB837_00543 [bacterium AB1]